MASRATIDRAEQRSEGRDTVFHRTTAVVNGAVVPLTIVDSSRGGIMARCDAALPAGASLVVRLPVVGAVEAEVRWALGGRIGCRFVSALDPRRYYAMLAQIAA